MREANSKPMDVGFLVQSNNPLCIRTAELIAADLKQVGISLPAIGSTNTGGFRNEEADKLATQLLEETGPAQQKTLTQQMEALIARELPLVMLVYADGRYVSQPNAYDG